MHVFETPYLVRQELATRAAGTIKPIIKLLVKMKIPVSFQANGTPNFGSQYIVSEYDVSNFSPRNKPISLEASKPILPIDGEVSIIKAGNVVMDILNPYGYSGLVDLDAIFKEKGWESTDVEILADINGIQFPMFSGRVTSRPEEKTGVTIIEARNELWKVVKAPVTFEKFAPRQVTYYANGGLIATPQPVGDMKVYDGISTFIQNGDVGTSVDNPDQDTIQINRLRIINGAKLGEYTIEFFTATDFNLTYPDNAIYQGTVTASFASPSVTIIPSDWNVLGDPTGKKITFFVYKTASGHPIDIILNELEKAFTEQYGIAPTRPAQLPINYPSFDRAKQYFSARTVYVCETNKDNKVWRHETRYKPMNALQFCQKIADHIGSQIIINNYGIIEIRTPGDLSNEIFDLTDGEILSHRVLPTKAFNYFRFQYGWNDGTETFHSFKIEDDRDTATDDKEIMYLNFPYYKQGVSDLEIESVKDYYLDRYCRSLTQIEIQVKPNWALPLIPGDKIRVVTNTHPRLNMVCEIFDSNKDIGGPGIFKCVRIPEPSKTRNDFCTARWCQTKFCE